MFRTAISKLPVVRTSLTSLSRNFNSMVKNGCSEGLKYENSTFVGIRCSQRVFSSKDVPDPPKKKKKKKVDKAVFDALGAWDTNEVPEVLMEASVKHGAPIPHVSESDVGYSCIIGKRSYQEDRFFIKEFSQNLLCCAVFDGHGGADCSEFCSQNIEELLGSYLDSEDDLETVLHNTIMQLNSKYKEWSLLEKKGEKSGSTCTVAILKGGTDLVMGHVGDSRVLLCRRGAPRRLTSDHCPSNALEKKRIEQAGGTVELDNIGRYMVNGALNMSRSIGDLHLKPYGVISVPDTRTFPIKHRKDSFLMLSTDGVNHVLADSEICDIINQAPSSAAAAEAVTEQALSMSSMDNLTAIVVPLGSWGEYAKSAASMFYSFGIGRNMTKSSRFG